MPCLARGNARPAASRRGESSTEPLRPFEVTRIRCVRLALVRRMAPFLIAATLVPFYGSVASAAIRPSLRVAYVTPKVSQRGLLTVRASVAPKTTKCKLALHGPHARVISLRAEHNRSGKLQWTYRVPTGTVAGHWTARVSCGSPTAVSRGFVVEAPVLKANVVVANSGFTQSNPSDYSEPFISYGVVLNNEAAKVDALNVAVTVSFTDTLGRSVATQTTTLSGIPAGGTFYLGGLASSNIALTVASMNVSVSIGSTQSPHLQLPSVTGLSLQPDSDGFGSGIGGTIQNPSTTAIPSTAEIYVVYLNAQGNVIGGDSEFSGAAVSPGSSVPFTFSDFSTDINTDFISPSDVATIDGSIDP